MTSWTVTVEENPDNPEELVMPIPPELLIQLDWNEGDTLFWSENEDGSFYLSKKAPTGETT